MKLFLMLTLTFFLIQAGQNTSSAQQSGVFLKDVGGEYKNLDEIKPVLVNESNESIYLLPNDCGEADLSLFYMNKTWMEGVSKDCRENKTSIEIKPGESYRIPPLVWRPLRNWQGKLIERKNFPGKYKISMWYSLKPIVESPLGKPQLRPVKHHMNVSEEFVIVQ